MVCHPLLAGLVLLGLRRQQSANSIALRQPDQCIRLPPPSDDRRGARTRSPLGSQNFGKHAATADAAACAAGHQLQLGITRQSLAHKRGRRIFARVGGEQAFLIGEDHQGIRLHQVRHQGTQGVVVAELDLVIHDRVVLVDHRDHTQFQESQQRGAGVQIALAVRQVGVR